MLRVTQQICKCYEHARQTVYLVPSRDVDLEESSMGWDTARRAGAERGYSVLWLREEQRCQMCI